jgi:multidrug efflux pump subunit AcrA (membrane-fusion protein)
MSRRYFYYFLLATLFGILLIFIYFVGKIPEKEKAKSVPLVHPQFVNYVSGVGIVEPESGNIMISSNFNRVVDKVNVSVNDRVKKGEILLQLDNQDLLANLRIKQKEYEKTLANLHKLEALPRSEDLIIAKETLNRAQTALNESKIQYDMVTNLPNPRAISKEEQDRRLYKYQQAEADLEEAKAQFEKVKSGAWQPDLNIARQEVEEVKAGVEAIESEIQRTYIKSPIDGTVLQIKIHEGETLDPSKAALILGNIDELNLKVSIDQFNITKFYPNSSAVAFRQGDHLTEFPLKFIHAEPSMIPKKYLTNDAQEKVDTQVFEILYRITKNNSHLYIGEQMDVYIKSENN